MRISDWSSDVCSSDLYMARFRRLPRAAAALAMIPLAGLAVACGSSDSDSAAGNSSADFTLKVFDPGNSGAIAVGKRDGTYDEALAPLGAKIEWEIGRETGRERVCQYE